MRTLSAPFLSVLHDPVDAMVTPPPETIEVDSETVSCDGNGGVGGHPLVYLNLGPKGFTDCPYCDRRFVLRQGAKVSADH
ncbi:MAG: zinc-finger domain-containing protein [Rhodospirillaceae bacterium]|nr:zinc-finger domain-containing protein [Rhodospirillaceae bacterium]